MLKHIGKVLAAAGAAVPVLARDLAGLVGCGLIGYGAWLVYPPAGFITGGGLLLVGSILLSVKRG